ncbi:MAG: DUF4132 domain-containing protein [Planctomycetaceae bacterium]|nr:DUF4132 domain-containing protein [Planctomycetaceae bacterium]
MADNKTVRMFEFEDDKSSKFWEVTVDGVSVTTRWGKIGANGQTKSKDYDSPAAAVTAANKAVSQKTKKGYIEVGDSGDQDSTNEIPFEKIEAAFQDELGSVIGELQGAIGEALLEPTASGRMKRTRVQSGVPDSITVEPALADYPQGSLPLTVAEAVVEQLEGFEMPGDFVIPQVGVKFRSFFRGPNLWTVAYMLGEIEWLDVRLSYESEEHSFENFTWTNVPQHDGLTPPWETLFHLPDASPADLLQLAREFEAEVDGDRVPQKFDIFTFAQTFEDAYRRDMDWRNGVFAEADSNVPTLDARGEIDRIADELLQRALGDRYDHADILCEDMLDRIGEHAKRFEISDDAKDTLRAARDSVDPCPHFNFDQTPRRLQIDKIVGDDTSRFPVEAGEVWANRAITDVAELPDEQQRLAWCNLGAHCLTATSSKPSAKWKKTATPFIKQIGADRLRDLVGTWLPLINTGKPPVESRWVSAHPLYLSELNQTALRGLIWCYSFVPDDRMAQLMATVGISAYRKIPQVGARAVKVGNACVFAISTLDGSDAVAQLALMKLKVKTGSARNLIEKQLEKAAKKQGISRAELEEISVPTYGMEEVGELREPLGDFTAKATIGAKKVQLTWLRQDGKEQKSVPAAVKAEFADDLKELKANIKDMEKMLSAQRGRIESQYLEPASWPFATWKERYLDHPVVGTIARRLLWKFSSADGDITALYGDGQFIGADGEGVSFADDATVQLWHPLNEPAESVLAWRVLLEERGICQPFKQAHREVYLVTAAELTTQTYSNRQAAHILSQAQYRSLAQSRRWKVNFLGAWDGGDEGLAEIKLNHFGMRAEFHVNAAYEEDEYEVRYVSTDQVRFFQPADDNQPISLVDVPPIVFSEIMRDVDLFVGVASVGNDPNWQDGGPEGTYRDYWHNYAFGDLTETAATRKEVLQRLIPRLKIADKCRIDGRFLEVQGQLRTYRIHLGSSNILMAPNDQYLCIVPARTGSKVDRISLPFEGDSTLSVILSKAFLLVDDHKIKDPSIISQIQGG